MPPHRKIPFSNKQKKEQLKAKRERKQRAQRENDSQKDNDLLTAVKNDLASATSVHEISQQPTKKQLHDVHRYQLHFKNDTREDIERGKRLSRQSLASVSKERLEVSIDDVYPADANVDIPKRPPWTYSMSLAEVEQREEKYFKAYVDSLFRAFGESRQLSYVELNLETWRQLWRVVEKSDIVLLIADIRYLVICFCPALYHYVVNEMKKHVILVLNKVDLAPVELVTAWKAYLKEKYPQLHTVCFTSQPRNVCSTGSDPGNVLHKRKRTVRMHNAVGPRQLLECCEQITAGAVDLTSWRVKIEDDSRGTEAREKCEVEVVDAVSTSWQQQQQQQPYDGGILTVGCCGYPNVGKSSLINGLMGKKVVSVSRTPGHTKHFQTVLLTRNVRLCDCPGLVFPSVVARPLQVLAGIYPIAQLREPYSAIRYLAERLPVSELLQLRHSGSSAELNTRWSAYDICEAWALKRGFLTAKAARPDVYRAANNILRMALEGRLCLCLRPPGFTSSQDEWRSHADTAELLSLLSINSTEPSGLDNDGESASSGSEQLDDEDQSNVDDDDDNDCDGSLTVLSSRNPFELLADN